MLYNTLKNGDGIVMEIADNLNYIDNVFAHVIQDDKLQRIYFSKLYLIASTVASTGISMSEASNVQKYLFRSNRMLLSSNTSSYYSEIFKQQISLAKSSGQEVLHSHVHPLRYIFNFLTKLMYMNKEITEKHLGEETWCFRNGGRLSLSDISILINSMVLSETYDSNLLDVFFE